VARRFGASVGATLRIAPLAVAATLAGPALWGLGGQLDPASFPKEWRDARQLVHEQPGTVVALPWYQYFTLDIAHNHLVLNVVPYYFGGDVLASSDPHLAPGPQQEAPDPREVPMNAIVADARNGQEISDRLVSLGIRWVVLQHDVDWKLYTGIPADRGLERVVSGATLDLYRVNAWRGPVLGDDGAAVPTQTIVGPLRQIDRSGSATFLAPYQSGWLRGWSSASRTPTGLIGLPPGAGLLWFWPALVVLGADLVVLATLLSSVVPGRLRRYWNSESSHTRAEMLDGLRADE
jgi:hypothetical protein